MDRNTTLTALAKALSVIMHPVLMPVYLICILLNQGLLLPFATPQAKIYFAAVIILNTVLVPAICMFLFNRLRFWRENPNADLRERILPMVVMTICYGACIIIIRDVPFALPVREMLVAGTACLIAGLIISLFMRVSLHMMAQGAVIAYFSAMMAGSANILAILCVSTALAAMLASARLYLGAHDGPQVGAGFLGGFAVSFLAIYFI